MTTHDVGEILRALGRLEQKVDSADEKAEAILTQAKLTNGRVTALERWRLELREHDRTMAKVTAQQEDAADDAATERDRKMTRRDNLRNVFLAALLAIASVVVAAALADLHIFAG